MPTAAATTPPPGDMFWHNVPAEAVLAKVGSGADELSVPEAAKRLAKHGPNRLPETGRRPLGRVFARQFASPLIYLLFGAAVIAFATGHPGDALAILVVVLLNAVIGTFQEGRAERSLAALRRWSALPVRVLRGATAAPPRRSSRRATSCPATSCCSAPMNRTFHTAPIPLAKVFLIGAVASVVLWAEEIRKFVARRQARREGALQ